jgi:hypothetical protein
MGGLFGAMLLLLAVSRLLWMLSHKSMANSWRIDFDDFLRYVKYYQSADLLQGSIEKSAGEINSTTRLESTRSFGLLLSRLMRSACALAALCFLLSLPIYILKELDMESASVGGETQYVTHIHMYNWLWTTAFVSGTTPAIILLIAGFVCLSYFNFVMNRLGGQDSSLSPLRKKEKSDQSHLIRFVAVWTVFLLNFVVIGTVNGLYIWSTLLDLASEVRLWIQISFALFSFLWSLVLRIGLPFRIKESRYGVWLFVCLSVMNAVLIPCAVTALSTPSCYQVSESSDFTADSHWSRD